MDSLFQNVFVEAVRAVVSPVTLRSSKRRMKLVMGRKGNSGGGRSNEEAKERNKCKVM